MISNLDEVNQYLEGKLLEMPQKYITRWESMQDSDFEILDAYVDEELIRPSTDNNEGEPRDSRGIIQGRKVMEELFDETMAQLTKNGPLCTENCGSETCSLKNLQLFPERSSKIIENDILFYEAMLAYARKIADDSGANALEIVRSKDGRRDIIRKIYSTKEDYLNCKKIRVLENAKLDEAYLESIRLMYEGCLICGTCTVEEAKTHSAKFPSKELRGKEYAEIWEVLLRKADGIYGN